MKKIHKCHKQLRRYVKRNPARASGYFATFSLMINKLYNFKSLGIMMFFTALIIGIGESAQRAENRKTIKAIYFNNEPDTPDEHLLNAIADSVEGKAGK
jgi:hypothetical protein